MNTFAACSGHQAMTKYFEREGGGETNTMILGTIKILFDHLSISITFKKIKELFLEKPFISSKSQTACQLLCPWGFSRQEYWNGLLCPPPGDLPDSGFEPTLTLMSPALAGGFFTTSAILVSDSLQLYGL